MISPIVNQHDISHLLKTDEIFVTIHNLYGPPPNWSRPQGFITISKIILEQQVSLQSANAHNSPYVRFIALVGLGAIRSIVFKVLLFLSGKKNHRVFGSREPGLDWLAGK